MSVVREREWDRESIHDGPKFTTVRRYKVPDSILRDDEYELHDSGHAWVGRRTKRQLRTGAHIRVMVTSVNPIEGLIDLALAEDLGSEESEEA